MHKHLPAVLLALGLVGWFQEIFSIEWSSPYCSNPVDGPASAIWGMPLPYIRWSGVSSLEYFWMPLAFFLNLVLLFAVAYPLVAWLLRKLDSGMTHVAAGITGAFLTMAFAAWIGLQINIGLYKIPVSNIANEDHESYSALRPVRFGFKSLRYQCTPLDK